MQEFFIQAYLKWDKIEKHWTTLDLIYVNIFGIFSGT